MKNFSVLLILAALCLGYSTSAQNITGPTTININTEYDYTFNNGTVYTNPNWVLATAGVIVSTSVTGTSYKARVKFTFSGASTISFSAYGTTRGSLSVTINCTTIPSVPTGASGGSVCNGGTTSISATVGANGNTLRWYSVSSGGTLLYTGTTFTTGQGNWYAASYSTSTGCVSSSRLLVQVSTGTSPSSPPSVVTSGSTCPGDGAVTMQGSTSSGIIYWFDNNTTGDHTGGYLATGTNYSTSISATKTFYMGGYIPGGCSTAPGSRTAIVATMKAAPPTPTTPTLSSNLCGPKTLTRVSPPAGETWYWQTTSTGKSTSNSSSTYSATSSSTYYLAAINGVNCWSVTYASVPTTVNVIPSSPGSISVSSNICGVKVLSYATSPSSGTAYYWQGTNSTTEDTSPTAAASTYSLITPGTYTLYAKTKSTAGCWSAYTQVGPVTVNNPSVPSAQGVIPSICEWDPISLTTIPNGTAKWYPQQAPLTVVSSNTYSAPSRPPGTYNYNVVSVDPVGCESTPVSYSVIVKNNCDDNINWKEEIAYSYAGPSDLTGTISSHSKAYGDAFGNIIQTQTKSMASNMVFASESIFDRSGHQTLSTLPAPINSSTFVYRYRFTKSPLSEARYSWLDFDVPPTSGAAGEVDNPNQMSPFGVGSLGWYYSSSNTLEPNTPRTDYPFARTYSPPGPNPVTSKSARPGNLNKMGGAHELKSEKVKITSTELSHYYAIRSAYFNSISGTPTGNPGYKIISTDADGKRTASFTDAEGNVLASALVTNVSGTAPNLTYSYDNWSYNFYNPLGQLVASVSPNGVVTSSTSQPMFQSTFRYDHLGRMIEGISPDEGQTQFVYSIDGKIRFSQNQEQRNPTTNKRFSYTNYDSLGRIIESGEYTYLSSGDYVFQPAFVAPSGNSVLNIADNLNYSAVTRRGNNATATRYSDTTFVDYDLQTSDFVGVGTRLVQQNLIGQVARTKNGNATTWYSYDEFGQLEWTIQNISGLGLRVIDYTYDFQGNVTQVAYQNISGSTDKLFHHYVYDADGRLVQASTSFDGVTQTVRAKYYYYLHGPLKRMELLNGTQKIQGLDYTYNIDGSLKAINNSDGQLDPGNDGGSSGFPDDVFGMALEYYDGDYNGGASIGSVNVTGFTDQFSGLIKAQRWHSAVDNDVNRAYAYQYDNMNQLTSATWGSVTGSSGVYTFSPSGSQSYKESIGGYDKNGNILALNRHGKDETILGDYTYHYAANKNQLQSVSGGTDMVTFNYDAVGRMIQQVEGSSTLKVSYNAYGLVKEVRNASDNLLEQYFYCDRGHLVKKTVYVGSIVKNTFYVRDVSGNPMAIYENTGANPIKLAEEPIYGASRIGMIKPTSGTPKYFYEVSDHLGNVRAVIGEPVVESPIATYETSNMNSESGYFLRLDKARRVSSHLFDHTNETQGGTSTTAYSNNFSSSYTGFQTYGAVTIALNAGRLKATGAVAGNHVFINVATITGRNYKVTGTIDLAAGSSLTLHAFDPPLNGDIGTLSVNANGTYSYNFIARSSSTSIMFTTASGPRDFYIDDLMVEDVSPLGTYAERLNGTANEKYGIARSLSVAPGDVVTMEVWGKYVDTNTANWNAALTSLMSQIAANSAGVVIDGTSYSTSTSTFDFAGLVNTSGSTGGPKAYLNWLVFNREDTLIDAGFRRLSSAPRETGQNVAHEQLSATIDITEPGYMYIYLSNEEPTGQPVEVYFDDFKVTHSKGKIVAGGDYYPFGLPMVTRQIDNERYRFGYQGQYSEKDSITNWNAFQLRMYDARFGRWISPDPYGQFASPYVGMGNMPNMMVDRDGGMSSTMLWTFGGMIAGGIAGGLIDDENRWRGAMIGMAAGAGIGYGLSFVNWSNAGSALNSASPGNLPIPESRGLNVPRNLGTVIPPLVSNLADAFRREYRRPPDHPTWDNLTNQRIRDLHPAVGNAATLMINAVREELGISLRISQGLRTIAEQDALYAQGRTAPGNIVTNARGGQSYHNYGLAFDVVEIINGAANFNTTQANWLRINNIAQRFGLEWGGNWTTIIDRPHFQNAFGLTIRQLMQIHGIELNTRTGNR